MIRIIIRYLQTNKRLVIPQLGALLVKEPSREILFSELIRRDDGLLRALLIEQEGMNELTAQGEIDRLVFEVRHAIEQGGEYRAEGLGVFYAGANATIAFRYDPNTKPAVAASATEQPLAEPEQKVVEVAKQPEQKVVAVAKQPEQKEPKQPEPKEEEQTEAKPTDQPHEEELHLTTSAKMNPAPYVKGLSYGKPPKNTDAFTYVDRPQRRGRVDSFLVVAILAVLIALGAMAYGYYHDWQERKAAEASIEASESLDAPTDEAGAATDSATTN